MPARPPVLRTFFRGLSPATAVLPNAVATPSCAFTLRTLRAAPVAFAAGLAAADWASSRADGFAFDAGFLTAGFSAGALRALGFLPGAFFAAAFLGAAFFGAAFFGAAFLGAAFFGAAFLGARGLALEADFFATVRFAAVFFAAGFRAPAFFAAGFFAAGFFVAGFFVAGFFVVAFFAAGFLAAGFLAAGFLAPAFRPDAASWLAGGCADAVVLPVAACLAFRARSDAGLRGDAARVALETRAFTADGFFEERFFVDAFVAFAKAPSSRR